MGKFSAAALALVFSAAMLCAQTAVPLPQVKATTEASSAVKAVPADSAVRLGAGDLVEVSVFGAPDLETKIRVTSDGDINLPLINDVHVEGLTIDEAESVIARRLQNGGFVKNPHVQIYIQEYTSQGASVLGEVARPGVYPVLGNQTLFNLVSAAGGLTDRAGGNIVVTHRGQPPITIPISRNLEDSRGAEIAVLPGDSIVVRRADVVYVVGDVGRPSGLLMEGGSISVLQAIALVGGANPSAKLNGTRIVRRSPAGLTTIAVPLKRLLEAKTNDLPMQADDILFVPASSRKLLQARTAEAAVQLATGVGLVAVRP